MGIAGGRKPSVKLKVRGEAGAGRVFGVALRVLVPRMPVTPVVELLRELRELQRMERVAHDGELVRLVHANRLLRESRLGTVRQTRGMERDRPDLDALARA